MKEQADKQLVDETIDAYVYWREESAGVWDAYERWARAPRVDAAGAFSAYRAALDREECAAHAYGDQLARFTPGKRPRWSVFGPNPSRAPFADRMT
jgi:hypothetical protein